MKTVIPLTAAQRRELAFDPPEPDCLPEKDAATVCSLRGCVVYIIEKTGRRYWYYVSDCRDGRLFGYRRSGGVWRQSVLPVARVGRYF